MLLLDEDLTSDIDAYDYSLEVIYSSTGIANTFNSKMDGNNLYVNMNEFASLKINILEKSIVCFARDYESFFSTFFNIPFSALFLLKGEFLLHTSSILHNDNIICISAEKGTGKSTLVAMLEKMDDINFFADDTLRLDHQLYGYPPHQLMKLHSDVTEHVSSEKLTGYHNVLQKNYIKYSHMPKGKRPVKALIFYSRNKNINAHRIVKIENNIVINLKFIKNIVGTVSLSPLFANQIINTTKDVYSKLNCYKLEMPDSLDYLLSNLGNLKSDILEIV